MIWLYLIVAAMVAVFTRGPWWQRAWWGAVWPLIALIAFSGWIASQ